jgi:hypothetical protein
VTCATNVGSTYCCTMKRNEVNQIRKTNLSSFVKIHNTLVKSCNLTLHTYQYIDENCHKISCAELLHLKSLQDNSNPLDHWREIVAGVAVVILILIMLGVFLFCCWYMRHRHLHRYQPIISSGDVTVIRRGTSDHPPTPCSHNKMPHGIYQPSLKQSTNYLSTHNHSRIQ